MELLRDYISQKRREYSEFYARVKALCASAEREAINTINREEQQLVRQCHHADPTAISAKIAQLHQARYLHFQNVLELLLAAIKQLSIGMCAPSQPPQDTQPVSKPFSTLSQPLPPQRPSALIQASRPSALIQASYTPIPPERFHTNETSQANPRSPSPITLIRHSQAPSSKTQPRQPPRPDITPTAKQYQGNNDPPAPSAELGSFQLTPLTPTPPSTTLSPPRAPHAQRQSVQIYEEKLQHVLRDMVESREEGSAQKCLALDRRIYEQASSYLASWQTRKSRKRSPSRYSSPLPPS